MIFVFIYRNQFIIDDIGLTQILHFSVGTILYFLSTLFITYMDFTGCAFNFLLKHLGISTIIYICYKNLILNYKLGHKKRDEKRFNFLKEELEKTEGEVIANSCTHVSSLDSIDNAIRSNEIRSIQNKSALTLKELESKSELALWDNETNYIFNSKIMGTHYSYLKVLSLYLIFIASIVSTTIYYSVKFIDNKEDNNEEELFLNNNIWVYKCNLDEPDLLFNTIYLVLVILISFIGRTLLKYESIYKLVIYITSSSYVFIITGPFMNVHKIYFYLIVII